MFECKLCGYYTERSTDLERHNKTKRHIAKLLEHQNNIFNCSYCDKSFTAKTNMYRHQKYNCNIALQKNNVVIEKNNVAIQNNTNVLKTQDDLYKMIEKLEQETQLLRDENGVLKGKNGALKKIEDRCAKLEDNNDKLLNLATQNSKTAEKSIRGITYAMKHLKNAQQLKLLKGNEAVKLLTYDNNKSKNDTVDVIIIKHKNKLLDRYLGDILIKAYKKNDPEIQSFWNVDPNRLNFILKEEKWTSDNCGIRLTNFIIDPFLKSVDIMIREYCELHNKHKTDSDSDSAVEEDRKKNKSSFDLFATKWGYCQEILIDISNKKLHKQLLKYISAPLKLPLGSFKNKQSSESESSFEPSSSDEKPKRIVKNIIEKKTKQKKIIVHSDSDSD